LSPIFCGRVPKQLMNSATSEQIFADAIGCCDAVCLAWQNVTDAREHVANVKADRLIMRYEEELCDARIDFENQFGKFKKCLGDIAQTQPHEEHSRCQIGELTDLLNIIMTAANTAHAEDFQPSTRDILRAVKNDVVSFAKKCKISTRLGTLSHHYKKPLVKKMARGAAAITASKR
jgi:hypothetical protein